MKTKVWMSSPVALSVVVILAAIAFPVYKTYLSSDPLHYMYPNFLLFTPFKDTLVHTWEKYIKYDTSIIYEPTHIPEIPRGHFSMEAMKKATSGWRYPAVARGLFTDTPAAEKWSSAEYLSSKIGDFYIPVVRSSVYGSLQNDRAVMTFREAFTEIVSDSSSKMYVFFPVKSRFSFNHSDLGKLESLQKKVNEVVLEDLDIGRIWPGFGTVRHATYFGAQLIAGQGSNDTEVTTGTGWHCAAGNNWFIQVLGSKRWYFLDPVYSVFMKPLRGGKVNMQTGNIDMALYHKHLPLRYVDLRAGDLLYNPDWEWHTIQNYEGLSIGVPMREVNYTLMSRNNLHYTGVVAMNKLFDFFGIDIGGYPK